jgi:hypothetical protein
MPLSDENVAIFIEMYLCIPSLAIRTGSDLARLTVILERLSIDVARRRVVTDLTYSPLR